ncbi:MAG: VanZ family protein [Roseateles sp.]|uniref:VanZ family protein n=1 Tax=Roseateles sp. TaxID=1971397 RepID=UPI0039ED09EB
MPPALLNLLTAPRHRPLWRALLAALVIAITWLALSPAPPKTLDTGWDKANHTLAFAALAFTAARALWPRPRQWGWLVLALLAYGAGIEVAQGFLPPREASMLDLLADASGIAAGLLPAWVVAALAARGR